jgi:hypothetical protein
MGSEKRPNEQSGMREPVGDAGPRDSGTSPLSPALTRAIIEQLLQHGRELGRREMIDLVGARYGWKREVADPNIPAPASLEA